MGVIFLLGFFFDFLEIILIILPVFTPIVRFLAPEFAGHLGFDGSEPLRVVQAQVIYWFAILVAINLQTSFLTPPFGFALFYMKGVAPKEVKMQSIYKGIIPFVGLQLIGLGYGNILAADNALASGSVARLAIPQPGRVVETEMNEW